MYKIYDNIRERYGEHEYAIEQTAQIVIDELIAEHEATGDKNYEYFIHNIDSTNSQKARDKKCRTNIKILYTLCTDGDYCLRDTKKFGADKRNDCMEDEYDYIGEVEFQDTDIKHTARTDAVIFLEEFLCDGLHIDSSHMWLIKDFYDIIEKLIDFIKNNELGVCMKSLSGNYEGTEFIVVIQKE